MTKAMLDWITKHYPEKFSGEDRKLFLQTLKKEPSKIEEWVAMNLVGWCTVATFAMGTGTVLLSDFPAIVSLVVKHFERHFSKELEKI